MSFIKNLFGGGTASDPLNQLANAIVDKPLRKRFPTLDAAYTKRAELSALEDQADVGSPHYAAIRAAGRLMDEQVVPRLQLAERLTQCRTRCQSDSQALESEVATAEVGHKDATARLQAAQVKQDRLANRAQQLRASLTAADAATTRDSEVALSDAKAQLARAVGDGDEDAEKGAAALVVSCAARLQRDQDERQRARAADEARLAAAVAEEAKASAECEASESVELAAWAALQDKRAALEMLRADERTSIYVASLVPLHQAMTEAGRRGVDLSAARGMLAAVLPFSDWRRVPFAPANGSVSFGSFRAMESVARVAGWVGTTLDLGALDALSAFAADGTASRPGAVRAEATAAGAAA